MRKMGPAVGDSITHCLYQKHLKYLIDSYEISPFSKLTKAWFSRGYDKLCIGQDLGWGWLEGRAFWRITEVSSAGPVIFSMGARIVWLDSLSQCISCSFDSGHPSKTKSFPTLLNLSDQPKRSATKPSTILTKRQ